MYAIPRANDCVFGGTNELSDNLAADPATTSRIVAECSRVLNIDKPPFSPNASVCARSEDQAFAWNAINCATAAPSSTTTVTAALDSRFPGAARVKFSSSQVRLGSARGLACWFRRRAETIFSKAVPARERSELE